MGTEPEFENVPVGDLRPWDGNPRRNDAAVEGVAKSIKRFGFGAPVVANRRDRRVIAGHTRLKAAAVLGLETVPVRWLDLDPGEADALALADNRLGEIADWDEPALSEIIEELRGAEISLDGLGWDDAQIGAILGTADAWQLGRHRIYVEDSLAQGARLRSAEGEITVLDPPFEAPENAWLSWLKDPSLVFCLGRHIAIIPRELFRFERVLLYRAGERRHRSATVGIVHEHAFIVQVGSAKILPALQGQSPRSVVEIQREEHGNYEKPLWLLEEHLTLWSPAWETVIDPFLGSGASLMVAERMGKRCIGAEMDPERVAKIIERWEADTGERAQPVEGQNG